MSWHESVDRVHDQVRPGAVAPGARKSVGNPDTPSQDGRQRAERDRSRAKRVRVSGRPSCRADRARPCRRLGCVVLDGRQGGVTPRRPASSAASRRTIGFAVRRPAAHDRLGSGARRRRSAFRVAAQRDDASAASCCGSMPSSSLTDRRRSRARLGRQAERRRRAPAGSRAACRRPRTRAGTRGCGTSTRCATRCSSAPAPPPAPRARRCRRRSRRRVPRGGRPCAAGVAREVAGPSGRARRRGGTSADAR